MPKPCLFHGSPRSVAVRDSRRTNSSLVIPGYFSIARAAAPDTMGVAMDVPLLLHRVCRFCRSGSARKHYRTESLSPEPQYPVYGSHHIFYPCRSTSHTFRDHFYNIFRHDNPPSEPFCYWPSPKYYRPPDRYYLQRRPREYYDPTTIPEIFATSAPCNVPSGLRSPQRYSEHGFHTCFHPQYPFQSFLHGITGALPLSVQHFSHHKLCLRCHSAKSSSGQFSASAYNPADMCPVSIIVIRKGTAFYKVGKSSSRPTRSG